MADHSGNAHDASDKKLDQAAFAAEAERANKNAQTHPGHDPEQIRQHDDAGKDRLFEGRIQHDDADKASDRNRLEKDVAKHHHAPDETGSISDTAAGAKRRAGDEG